MIRPRHRLPLLPLPILKPVIAGFYAMAGWSLPGDTHAQGPDVFEATYSGGVGVYSSPYTSALADDGALFDRTYHWGGNDLFYSPQFFHVDIYIENQTGSQRVYNYAYTREVGTGSPNCSTFVNETFPNGSIHGFTIQPGGQAHFDRSISGRIWVDDGNDMWPGGFPDGAGFVSVSGNFLRYDIRYHDGPNAGQVFATRLFRVNMEGIINTFWTPSSPGSWSNHLRATVVDTGGTPDCQFFYHFNFVDMPPAEDTLELIQDDGTGSAVIATIPVPTADSTRTGTTLAACNAPVTLRLASGTELAVLSGPSSFTAPAGGPEWVATLTVGQPATPAGEQPSPDLEQKVEPPDTSSPACFTCDTGAGCVVPRVDSLDLSIGLGGGLHGERPGYLRLHADIPSDDLYKPASLARSAADGYETVLNGAGDAPLQFVAPTMLANVIDTDPLDDLYQLEFYHRDPAAVPNPDGTYPVTGQPSTTVSVENPDGTGATNNQIKVTRLIDATTEICEYSYDAATDAWTLTTEDGTRVETVDKNDLGDTNGNTFTETEEIRTLKDGSGNLISKTKTVLEDFDFGTRPIEYVLDPGGRDLTRTWQYHDTLPSSDPLHGKLDLETQPSGQWTRYEYTLSGGTTGTAELTKRIHQFLDAADTATENASRVEEVTFDPPGPPAPAELRTETLLGQEVSRRYRIEQPGGFDDIVCLSAGATWEDPANLVTETRYYTSGDFVDDLASVVNPDGTMTLYDYSVDPVTEDKTTTVKSGVPNLAEDDIIDGTESVTITNRQGYTLATTVTDIVSGLATSQSLATVVDAFGRPTTVSYPLDGTTETTVYGCCGVDSRTDRRGITTTFTESPTTDTETRLGITLTTTTAALPTGGLLTTSTRTGTDTSVINLGETETNLAGETIRTRDARAEDTTFSETIDGGTGHTVRTTTFPDTGTRIETYYPDGSLFTIGGTAGYPRKYEYGVDPVDGPFTKEIFLDGAVETEWVKTFSDFVGRTTKTIRPLPPPAGGTAISQSFYNAIGQLVRTVDPDGITTLYAYDNRGRRTTVAVDMDGDDIIDFDGTDRITKTATAVTTRGSETVERTTQSVYTTDNDDSAIATLSATESAVDGRDSWIEVGGLTTHTNVTYGTAGAWTETVTFPDNSTRLRQFTGGRLASDTLDDALSNQILSTAYAYDAHGRLQTVADARNGATTYTYYDDDQIHTITTPDPDPGDVTDAPQVTAFVYDSMGRRDIVDLPDHTVGDPKQVDYNYFPTGDLEQVSGARSYTVDYAYTAQGRLETLTTAGGTTTWDYFPESGLLEKKIYNDGTDVDYTYTPSGRVETRTTERGILTTYGYNDAGQLDSIAYSDPTPGVTYGYNRLGQLDLVTRDGAMRTLNYNVFGQLKDESIAGGLLNGASIDPGYDALRRRDALTVSKGAFALPHAYTYDDASRLETVAKGPQNATYAYEPNSALVSDIEFREGGTLRGSITKTHDFLNRLESITSISTGINTLNQSFAYRYNAANQRARIDLASGDYWEYGYDGFGHVDDGRKKDAADQVYPARQFTYTYDAIGNRLESRTGFQPVPRSVTYTPKTGDPTQYDTITSPGYLDVTGTADASAVVTVNGGTATRQGDYFASELPVDNTTAAAAAAVTIEATLGPDTDTINRSEIVPAAAVTYQYDLDGNLENDGYRTFTWDGENRLLKVETIPSAVPSVDDEYKIEFAYDYLGRRIRKTVSRKITGPWVMVRDRKFLYDGWNLVAEFEADDKLVKSYLWGLDLDGQNGGPPHGQGAGGVGGLLAVTQHLGPESGTHFATYDGNGNVTALADGATGNQSANYEYDPFGQKLQSTGPATHLNPFGFSTKYRDGVSGLAHYTYRYLDTRTGRWLSRDKIGFLGGLNLYGFLDDDPISYVDDLGLVLYAFDGTGNDRESDAWGNTETLRAPTNVAVLVDLYAGERFYRHGVGTRTNIKLGNLFGRGLNERVDWMMERFREYYCDHPEDPIDIIGFSRGASSGRIFSNQIARQFPDAKIRFLGLFDSVAQIGFPNRWNFQFGRRLDIPTSAQYTAHAVAKNDYRRLFPLTSITNHYRQNWFLNSLVPRLFTATDFTPNELLELRGANYWEKPFDGAHSDVGGGYWDGRNLEALRWMIQQGHDRGVPFQELESYQYFHHLKDITEPHETRYPLFDAGRGARMIFPGNL